MQDVLVDKKRAFKGSFFYAARPLMNKMNKTEPVKQEKDYLLVSQLFLSNLA